MRVHQELLSSSASRGDDLLTGDLRAYGYSTRWEALFEPYAAQGLVPARVVRSDRGSVLVATADEVFHAKPSGRLVRAVGSGAGLPAVGDWVAVRVSGGLGATQTIEAVLDRTSTITRLDPEGNVQVLAANIDTVFVVHPISGSPNLRRIERELSVAWDSGAVPVVLLTKADLSDDPEAARAAVQAVALGADVVAVNALAGDGTGPILAHITAGLTAVLVGPSGAGKSTLVNSLLGEQRQATHAVRESDGRGMHTTVARELIQMPGGGVLIDTPGLRAFGLTGSEEGIASVFPEVEELSRSCRFRDCTHNDEPGCAVVAAADSGALPRERLASYQKLMGEAQSAAAQTVARLRAEKGRKQRGRP